MYEALIARVRYHIQKANFMGLKEAESTLLLGEAADAIETLICEVATEHNARLDAEDRLHWIPVTEQCPEKSGDYLVFDDCRNLYVNEWHCLLKKWQYDDSRITHWQPLPEPPKEA